MNQNEALVYTQILGNVLGVLIPLCALFIARRELNKWRTELIGRNRIELAQQLGRAAVKFRNSFSRIFSKPIYEHEYSERQKSADEAYQLTYLLDKCYTYRKRAAKAHQLMEELEEQGARSRNRFQKDIREYVDECRKIITGLESLIDIYEDTLGGASFPGDHEGNILFEMEVAQFEAIRDGKISLFKSELIMQQAV
ncbi:MAG: hypothetical protein IPK17_19420 [Chloroflexi bacterium]|uniref:hypothetical protein n=1 Tax=Candidatus Flexifilum breve TaxID=3140694 RepID=UPI0031361B04|nr:hypothetical protein [Chloroflexota bacterium]